MKSKNNPDIETQALSARTIFLVVGIVFIAINLRPALTSVGPLMEFIRDDVGLSGGFAGFLTTLPLLGFAVMSPLAPRIGLNFGMERMLIAGLIILAGGIFIRSVSLTPTLFVGTALAGLGIAICNVLLPGLIKHKFPERVGLMTSVYTTFMGIFAASASGLSVPLARGLGIGWQKALACWAMLVIAALIVWLPQLRYHHKPTKPREVRSTSSRLLRSPLAWKVTCFMGLQSFSFYVTITWLPEILHDKGMTVSLAGWMLFFVQFISLPATFFAPVLADRMKDQRAIVIAISAFYFLGFGGLIVVGGNFMLTFLSIVCIGCAQGASISLALAFLGLRATNARQAAELSGMAQSIGYLLAAIGPILIGFLFDLTHSWTLPLSILLATGVLMTIAGIGAARNEYVMPNTE